MVDEPKVKLDSESNPVVLEVEAENAHEITSDLLKTLTEHLNTADRIYIELGKSQTEETTSNVELRSIKPKTAPHAVASLLKEQGPLPVAKVVEACDEYAESTLRGALTQGRKDGIFTLSEGESTNKWSLTTHGHEQVNELGKWKGGD